MQLSPPMWWIINHILTYLYKNLYKNSGQINRFCSKNGGFLMILAKFYLKFLQKKAKFAGSVRPKELCFSNPSHALNLRIEIFTKLHFSSFKTIKFASSWGRHIPLRHPPEHASAIGANGISNAPSSHPLNVEDGSTHLAGWRSARLDLRQVLIECTVKCTFRHLREK